MPNEEEYARETIRLVRDLTENVVSLRQEVTRATAPLFPRILGLERRLDADTKARVERQKEMDDRLDKQDAVLGNQNEKLDALDKRSRWRLGIDIAIIVLLVIIALVL